MRSAFLSIFFLLLAISSFCQVRNREDLEDSYKANPELDQDTVKLILEWNLLAGRYMWERPDSGIYYAAKALDKSRSNSFVVGELDALYSLGVSYLGLGDYSKAARIMLETLRLAEESKNKYYEAFVLRELSRVYSIAGEYKKALRTIKKSNQVFKEIENMGQVAATTTFIGSEYFELGEIDSAFYYCYEGIRLGEIHGPRPFYQSLAYIHEGVGNTDSALFYYKKGYATILASNGQRSLDALRIAKLYHQKNESDSVLFYANLSLKLAQEHNLFLEIKDASLFLSTVYEKENPEKALAFHKSALAYSDSISNMARMSSFKDFQDYDEQQRVYELEKARREYRNQIKTVALSSGLLAVLVIASLLYRNNRVQKKSKRKTEAAYEQLKNTQTQLIHSEKMASLGELTAGIAHEIQNPLNFVNNFSDLNKELIDEQLEELDQGDIEEAKAIANDIKSNEEKVTYHGKRAEQIVKSMLQHSRTGSGEKEPTDINALCDEYLRLSYHGYRAKDQSFQSDFKLDLDLDLPKVKVVPQDIGRVLLNLINNAFQAVSAITPEPAEGAKAGGNYKPLVTITTKLSPFLKRGLGGVEEGHNSVVITVSDNGPGISDDIKDKIFQPFFTTKPTGEGTGLGLSMSYDIVTKGHGGTIEVESSSETGSTFIINLNL